MTSRRCTVLERGACEQLQLSGYEVRILPHGKDQRFPPAYLVAGKKSGETRHIRIYKCSARLANIYRVEECFARVIQRYRTDTLLLRRLFPLGSKTTTLHLEIWISNNGRFTCLEVLAEGLREVSHV